MNICIVCDSYPGLTQFGGIAVYSKRLADALVVRGHKVHILVAAKMKGMDYHEQGVNIHVRTVRHLPLVGNILQGLGQSLGAAFWLFSLHLKYKFDVVEFPNWEGLGFVFSLWKTVPLVIRLYTSMIESVETLNRKPRFGERFLIWMEKISAKRASAVVTHSNAHLIKYASLYGINPSHIGMIPLGLEETCFANTNVAGFSKAVLTVGPLNARKGSDTLMEAIPIVLAQVPDAEFWIVGKDKNSFYEQRLFQSLPSLNRSRVRFFSFVEENALVSLYENCGIYVSASVYESFGLTFIEAMARRKPVVGCRVSAIPEIVQHEQNGILVPPNNAWELARAIIRLLQDTELKVMFGGKGYEIAKERYSASRMARAVEVFYQAVSTK